METKLGKVGVIGRFKPLHHGAVRMLEAICEQSKEVIIGIGSSNKYNVRNPFTPEETEEMLRIVLSPNYSNFKIVYVPDSGHLPEYSDGFKWKEDVKELFGKLAYFISGNEYVRSLLKDIYSLIHPHELVSNGKWRRSRGTEVRFEMARCNIEWKKFVPKEIADYLENKRLLERFQKEFGLQTIASIHFNKESMYRKENLNEEKLHTKEL